MSAPVTVACGTLCDYTTGEALRDADERETRASIEALRSSWTP